MSTNALARAFARQAFADYETYRFLEAAAGDPLKVVPVCHRLLFLQMACEKLSRARLYRDASDTSQVKDLHTHTEKQLPLILRETYSRQNRRQPAGHVIGRWRQLAASIQVLAPSAKGGGWRPDNCEYPWTDITGNVVSPLEHIFEAFTLLRDRGGPGFLKMLELSLERAVQEYTR